MEKEQIVNGVRKRIECLKNDTENVGMIFLNRYESIAYASTPDEGPEMTFEHLAVLAGAPYWEICTVRAGEIFISVGDAFPTWHKPEHITDEVLANAVMQAVTERTRFYSEREKFFGANAWPQATAAGK